MSVTTAVGAKPCVLSSFRISFSMALLFLPGLDQEIQNLPFTIYGAPQIHIPVIDRDEYLIEMPACVCGWMRSSELSGVGRPNFTDQRRTVS